MGLNKEKYKETTFVGMLKINGLSFFANFSLLYSLLFFCIIHLLVTNFNFCSFENYNIISKEIFTKISGTSSSIFGIVIAALAVTMTIFNEKIVGVLEDKKLLHKFLFPFWFLVFCWGTLILVSFFAPIIDQIIGETYKLFFNYITAFGIWLFIYALFLSINITGLLIRLFIQNSKIK